MILPTNQLGNIATLVYWYIGTLIYYPIYSSLFTRSIENAGRQIAT